MEIQETDALDAPAAKRIIVTKKIPREWFPETPGFELVFPEEDGFLSRPELYALLEDADAAVALLVDFDAAALEHAPKLAAVSSFGAGYDNIDVKACTQRGVLVVNAPDAVTEPTAEFSIGMIMDTLRTITWRDRQLRNNPGYSWNLAKYPSRLVMNKTLGIVGMGRIGKAVARRALALDMKIAYYQRRRLSEEDEAKYAAHYLPLDELMASSDVVSLHIPLTDETNGMIGAHELSLMKPDAHLVNMARGAVVDEAALLRVLREKKIAGAALDVFVGEPIINPAFKTLDNVILTPHVATDSAEARAIIAQHAVMNLVSALNGERPKNFVNPEVLDRP